MNWNFLQALLCELGFFAHWAHLIMSCVGFVFYSIVLNGLPQEYFSPLCGLRQGDSLWHNIFILVLGALSSMLHKKMFHEDNCMDFNLVLIAHRSHIFFFVDDSLFFLGASKNNVLVLKICLDFYCVYSG